MVVKRDVSMAVSVMVNGGKATKTLVRNGGDIDSAKINGLVDMRWLTARLLAVAVYKNERTTYDGEDGDARLHCRTRWYKAMT